MKTDKQDKSGESAYLFSLDILIQGRTNGQALERLMALLNNSGHIADYRVTNGVRLGQVIDEAIRLAESKGSEAVAAETRNNARKPASAAKDGSAGKSAQPAAAGNAATGKEARKQAGTNRPPELLVRQISAYIAGRTLVRLTVVKGRGVKLNIPCRILNYDESTDNMTVYHVDEKAVYTFKLTEIDDLTV